MAIRQSPEKDELVVLDSSRETKGELFRFEYIARAVSAPPENHVHDRQEERVEVVAGTVSCRINDEEVLLRPGDTLTFPVGVPHAVWNADPKGSRAVGEFRPALETQELFEAIFGAS